MVPKVPSNTQALPLCVWDKLNHIYGLLLSSHWTELQNLTDPEDYKNTLRSISKNIICLMYPLKGGGNPRHKNQSLQNEFATGLLLNNTLIPFYMQYSARMFFPRFSTDSTVQFTKIHFIRLFRKICFLK